MENRRYQDRIKIMLSLVLFICFAAQTAWKIPIVNAAPAQTTASHVAKLLNEVEAVIGKAQSEQVNLISPSEFKKAFEKYDQARIDDSKGKNQKDILKKLSTAKKHLNTAFNNARKYGNLFTEILAAREAAIDADAPQYSAGEYEEAEKYFESGARKIEDGNTKSGEERMGKAVEKFRDSELIAIKVNIIGKVHTLLGQAGDIKAEKYAPISYLKSQTLIQEAENILNTDRKKQSLARRKAEEAEYEAKHAMYLSRLAQDYKGDDTMWEQLVLEHEDLAKRTARELKLKGLQYDNGLIKPMNKIQRAVQSLNNNIKNLQEEIQIKNKELAQQASELKKINRKLNKSKEAEVVLKDKLEAKKRREEKMRRVENLFKPAEAKVIREGTNLKIRMIGLNFKPGKDVIDADFFGLLTKVQKAIRDFPQAQIIIEGHTDSRGNSSKNMRLSRARANAVKSYLQANMGLSDSQIKAVGYGAARPIASNTSKDGRKKNRRIDIVIDLTNMNEF